MLTSAELERLEPQARADGYTVWGYESFSMDANNLIVIIDGNEVLIASMDEYERLRRPMPRQMSFARSGKRVRPVFGQEVEP